MKLITLNDKKIKIPESWTEIPFSRFLKFHKLTSTFKTKEELESKYSKDELTKEFHITLDNLKSNTKIASFWTGLDEEEVSMCDLEDVSELMKDLHFMTEAYAAINITSFKFKGEEYFVPEIGMSADLRDAVYALREFMFRNVYIPEDRGKEGRAARNIIVLLHEHYQENKQSIPEEYRVRSETFDDAVKDYISGMTDQYAIRVAESIDQGISSVFSGRLL